LQGAASCNLWVDPMKQSQRIPDPRPGRPSAEEIKKTTKHIPKSEVEKPSEPVPPRRPDDD
jgi:hypothetical protein